MPSADNKRIAKNTLFLYIRMFLTIIVNLYAVRVIWQVLGVDDYGIYNVVGGVITMFAFLNNAMVASSQRFISFELGTGNRERLRKVFCLSVTIHLMLAVAVLILAETVGLWFLNDRLNIPANRMTAANWVYQCSVFAFLINIVSVPYNACIVAHEHMKAYGYFGILEVLLKLLIVFMLMLIPFDKLITYAILVVCVSAIMRLIYGIYCNRHFSECHYRFVSDRHLMRDMFSFAGWSFLGNLGFSVRDQGLNIVLNLFFNVAVNAAKGIANQIGGVVNGFAASFQMALNPQITKRYAAGQTESMISLVFTGCKYSAILIMFIVIPLFFAAEQVLHLWLGDVAPYTVGFLQLVLVNVLIDSMVSPVTTALQATGHIKWFQIIISIIMVSSLPIAWIWLKLGGTPYTVMTVSILTSVIALIARFILLHREVPFSHRLLYSNIFIPITSVLVASYFFSDWIYGYLSQNITSLLIFFVCNLLSLSLFIVALGLNNYEREILYRYIVSFAIKILKWKK